jgi:cysteine-rich repeat protein
VRLSVLLVCILAAVPAPAAMLSFGLPHPLNVTAFGDRSATDRDSGQDDTFPRITTDGAGTWVAVWDTRNGVGYVPPFPTFGPSRVVVAARSTDGARTWSFPVPVVDVLADNQQTNLEAQDTRASIATNGRGLWVTVWRSRLDLVVRGQFKGTDQDILVATSVDGGASWQGERPLTVSYAVADTSVRGASPNDAPEIAFVPGSNGGAFLTVWYTNNSTATNRVLAARSTGVDPISGAPTWPECPTVLNPHPNPPPVGSFTGPCAEVFRLENASDSHIFQNEFPHLATDGRGHVVVVWSSGDPAVGAGNNRDIVVVRSDDGGSTWSPPALLNASAGSDSRNDFDARVATDGSGTWIVVWQLGATGAGATRQRSQIAFAVSTDDGQTWSEPALISTNLPTDQGDDLHPQVAHTNDGWLAVWQTSQLPGATVAGDYHIAVSTSPDGGTWAPPTLVSPTTALDQGANALPQIASDRTTRVVVWESTDTLTTVLGPNNSKGTDNDILVVSDPGCGNGRVEPGETCDDGNLLDGDCCSATCSAAEDGILCAPDGKPCSLMNVCMQGVCTGIPRQRGVACQSRAGCVGPATCDGESLDCPSAPCDDHDPCTDDTCPDPATGCTFSAVGGFRAYTCAFDAPLSLDNCRREKLLKLVKRPHDHAKKLTMEAMTRCSPNGRKSRALLQRAVNQLEVAIVRVVILGFAHRLSSQCVDDASIELEQRAARIRDRLKAADVKQACKDYLGSRAGSSPTSAHQPS